jgi:hypothetical protein
MRTNCLFPYSSIQHKSSVTTPSLFPPTWLPHTSTYDSHCYYDLYNTFVQCPAMSLPFPQHGTAEEQDKKVVANNSEPSSGIISLLKPGPKSDQDTLNVAFGGGIRAPSPDPSIISIDDLNNVRLGRNPDYLDVPDARRYASPSPGPRPRSLKARLAACWRANKGLALVMISQMFGTLMNVTTRLLEREGNNGGLILNCC